MAFYISQPKVRQAGFELPNKQDEERQPSPTYDPSMYFAHNNFGTPFDGFNRLKYSDNHAPVDFTDTLASMISESDARNAANGTPHPPFHAGQPQPNPFDPHQFPHASSGHPILSPTGSAFSPAHGFPASAPTTSHPSFFDGADYAFLRGGTDRADTPSLASPTTADSPFSTTAPPLTTAPSKRGSGSAASRSRSRGPAAASTSRSRARKRASISSPSPPPASAGIIPSQNAWYIPTHGSHNDNPSFFASSLAMAGASPKSLGAKVTMAEDLAAKQAQLLSEKRRRRRESHNAVERRRRDNINEKISELSTLIPECLLSDNPAAAKDDVLGAVDEESTREGPKANKGMILRKSVDYIKYLQQLVRAQASRNRELESQLSQYRGATSDDPSDNSATLLPLLGTGDPATAVDLSNLVPIEDEDMVMSPSAAVPLNTELTNQIIATLEGRPEMGDSPRSDDDDDLLEEDERGRQAARCGRFGRGVSLSVGKSERVDEVDESALSDGSGKMED